MQPENSGYVPRHPGTRLLAGVSLDLSPLIRVTAMLRVSLE